MNTNRCCPIVELRQYTLHPGMRDTLIELFDRELIESQEALGMAVIGQFRVVDDADHFVWLRGFADMTSRKEGLSAFYGGPVWKAHREAANATMIDSDNVLLLRPALEDSGFALDGVLRPPVGTANTPQSLITAVICLLDGPADAGLLAAFRRERMDISVLAAFVTEPSTNDFPALPVREGESAFVWFSTGDGAGADLPTAMASRLAARPVVLRLSPTARSRLRAEPWS